MRPANPPKTAPVNHGRSIAPRRSGIQRASAAGVEYDRPTLKHIAPCAKNSDSFRGRNTRAIISARAAGTPASKAAGEIGSLLPGTICRTSEIVSRPQQPAKTEEHKYFLSHREHVPSACASRWGQSRSQHDQENRRERQHVDNGPRQRPNGFRSRKIADWIRSHRPGCGEPTSGPLSNNHSRHKQCCRRRCAQGPPASAPRSGVPS